MKSSKVNLKFLLLIGLLFVGVALVGSVYAPPLYEQLLNSKFLEKERKIEINNSSDSELENQLNLQSKATYAKFEDRGKIYYKPDGPVPTNKVWSSVVFTGELTGLYTFPIAANTANGTLNVTFPQKNVYEKLITAQIRDTYLALSSENRVENVHVISFSTLSVDLGFEDINKNLLFTARFIQGSPYVYIFPNRKTLTVSGNGYTYEENEGKHLFTNDSGNNFLVATDGDVEGRSDTQLQLKFANPQKQYVTLGYFTNEKSLQEVAAHASNIVEKVDTSFEVKADKVVVTHKISYSVGKKASLFGMLPHQYKADSSLGETNPIYTANTLRGEQRFIQVKDQFTHTIARLPMLSELPVGKLNSKDQQTLNSLLEKDIRKISPVRSSAYFGGNDLQMLAQLVQIASHSGDEERVKQLTEKLKVELVEWFKYENSKQSRYFAFDEVIGGFIGFETGGFGGENFNDHHFQYGYFIYAASVLAQHDKQFLQDYGGFINALVKDIANPFQDDSAFPYMRYFDHFEGHSWATGFGNFSDGNNQESTSEAINAWYAVWLWSQVIENKPLEESAIYLYSSEVNSARHYWLNWYNDENIFPKQFGYNKGSLLWGGKVEYQTWFSMEPQSIEGIQYLPFTPGSVYLYNRSVIERDLKQFRQELAVPNAHLIDLNYGYYAMLQGFDIFPTKLYEQIDIDEAMTRSNYYYWTHFWDNVAQFKPIYSGSQVGYQITTDSGAVYVSVECGLKSVTITLNAFRSGAACN